MLDKPLVVLGAGSWGTALAIQFARGGRETVLWGRDPAQLKAMRDERINARYLPDAPFPEKLTINLDFAETISGARDILIAVPSHAFRAMLEKLEFLLPLDARVAWATKGFEENTGKLPHQVAREILGDDIPTAVLSGPTFAAEVGQGLPTAMTIASNCDEFARELAEEISDPTFRAYTTHDMVGVEVGGAVKNVLAIGAGISDGLGFGANTRVALITRGIVEMSRLGMALGADQDTFLGLAGVGDLMLTCTDNLSRNRRMGLALAAGKSIDEAAEEIGQVVEGVRAARAVMQVAKTLDVEMPIVAEIYQVLYEGKAPKKAVSALMTRGLKSEK
ncbi:MAG: NAD(P)-dependent glycerol-3-phosphate dehydrogenase [Gammaproteobacteria bacterium]|nr:NAD(P)-dependent glycerol-3-phosphate dehydrogenase [Gammaproteobacteria bacterium]